MKNDQHIISVCIPTIGRETLLQTKEALQRQSRQPDEVIIIEDKQRRGVSWARNEGIRRSRGDLIAFTDDDSVPPADWLEKLIGAIDRYDADGVGGTQHETDPLLHEIRMRRGFPNTEQEDKSGLVGNGANVLYKRSLLDQCIKNEGFVFNELLRHSQDVELSWRLRRRGVKLIFIPTNVIHLRRMGPIKYCLFQFSRGKGIAWLHIIQRSLSSDITLHKSLLWENSKGGVKTNWLRVLWYKALGPFDMKSFSKLRYFILFWFGEKFKATGFLYELFKSRLSK